MLSSEGVGGGHDVAQCPILSGFRFKVALGVKGIFCFFCFLFLKKKASLQIYPHHLPDKPRHINAGQQFAELFHFGHYKAVRVVEQKIRRSHDEFGRVREQALEVGNPRRQHVGHVQHQQVGMKSHHPVIIIVIFHCGWCGSRCSFHI